MFRSFLAAALAAVLSLGWAQAQDEVVDFSEDDAEMNAAIAEAQATLGDFFQEFDNPRDGSRDFALKVAVSDGRRVEHFWAVNCEVLPADRFACIIANEPVRVFTVALGERHEFGRADISDWLYSRGGKLYGAFTLRVMLPHLSPGRAAELRASLAPKDAR